MDLEVDLIPGNSGQGLPFLWTQEFSPVSPTPETLEWGDPAGPTLALPTGSRRPPLQPRLRPRDPGVCAPSLAPPAPAPPSGFWRTCLNSCRCTARRWKACSGAPGFWARKASSLKVTGWPWKKDSDSKLPPALQDPLFCFPYSTIYVANIDGAPLCA